MTVPIDNVHGLHMREARYLNGDHLLGTKPKWLEQLGGKADSMGSSLLCDNYCVGILNQSHNCFMPCMQIY